MSLPSVLVVAPSDDALHAHTAQRVRAFERLGCRVGHCDLTRPPGGLKRWLSRDEKQRFMAVLEEFRPDLVLAVGAAGLTEKLIRSARAASSARWVNWLPDDLRYAASAAHRAVLYESVFAIGSDVALRLRDVVLRDVEVLPFAADPSVYRPARSRDQYRANVVFAGAATPRREALLAGLVEFGLALWGPGWRATSLRDYCRGELIRTDEYVRAYNGATVAVNIHHTTTEYDTQAACNQRVFELAAMGLPQVVDDRGDLASWFTPGRDVAVYRTAGELRDLVRELVMNPAAGEALGASARRVALERHTYMHRARRLLEALGMLDGA